SARWCARSPASRSCSAACWSSGSCRAPRSRSCGGLRWAIRSSSGCAAHTFPFETRRRIASMSIPSDLLDVLPSRERTRPEEHPRRTRRKLVAIAGGPNCGKSTLFNKLTGLRQKVANYPGVTVEKKAGFIALPSGRRVEVLDLPGTYSLRPGSPDEVVVRDVLLGVQASTPL